MSKCPAVDLCQSWKNTLKSHPGTWLGFPLCTRVLWTLLLLWKSWTVLNPTPMVSRQKYLHHFYLELKQVLVQYCCLTKSRWIGEPKHQAQSWVWSSLWGSSSLGFGFADGYSCQHNLCPQSRHWGVRENFPCWSSPWPCRLWSFVSEMILRALWLNHFSCSQWCRAPANSAKTLRASCCQLLILLLGTTKPHCSTAINWK